MPADPTRGDVLKARLASLETACATLAPYRRSGTYSTGRLTVIWGHGLIRLAQGQRPGRLALQQFGNQLKRVVRAPSARARRRTTAAAATSSTAWPVDLNTVTLSAVSRPPDRPASTSPISVSDSGSKP